MTNGIKELNSKKAPINRAMENFARQHGNHLQGEVVPFDRYLEMVMNDPTMTIRNIFQLFHDMIRAYISGGVDEYEGDPESINYMFYDTSKLFFENADNPFFADRLFTNRLVKLVDNFRSSIQQNKIYNLQGTAWQRQEHLPRQFAARLRAVRPTARKDAPMKLSGVSITGCSTGSVPVQLDRLLMQLVENHG